MPRQERTALRQGVVKPGSRTQRIRLSSNPDRPFKMRQKSLIGTEKLQKNPWWWVLHRRGIFRRKAGMDPLEARAISHDVIKGTLPERIVYKFCVDTLKHLPGVDIDFQSSLLGGRLELGGIVADFLFPLMRIVLQVQGPTHDKYARMRKDDEQTMILSEMGWHVHHIDDDIIYSQPRFEAYMRSLFNLGYPNWGGSVQGMYIVHDGTEVDLNRVNQLAIRVEKLFLRYQDANSRLLGVRIDV